MYSFSYLEPVCCSMSSSNCYFLTCIQVSQEADQVVWCSHLFQNFPQFIVIHTVKGFGIVSKAEIDVFLELSCFFDDPLDVGSLISGSSAFQPAWTSGSSRFTYCWSLACRIFSITLVWFSLKNRKIDLRNRTDSPKTESHSQLMFDRGAKAIQWKKDILKIWCC